MTLRLYRATLRHYITLPEQSWHSQVSKGAGHTGLRAGGGGAWVGGQRREEAALSSPPLAPWSPKLLEFLDVLDDPVLGYLPPTVITVLHTHLFSCAVDYRYRAGRWCQGGGRLSLVCQEPAPASLSPPGPSTSLCVSLSPPRPSPSPVISSWTPPLSCSGTRPRPPELGCSWLCPWVLSTCCVLRPLSEPLCTLGS